MITEHDEDAPAIAQKARGRMARQGTLVAGLLGIGLTLGGTVSAHAAALDNGNDTFSPDCFLEFRESSQAGLYDARAVCENLPAGANVGVTSNGQPGDGWSATGAAATEWTEPWLAADQAGFELQYRADPSGAGSKCSAEHIQMGVAIHTVKVTCDSLLPFIKARGVFVSPSPRAASDLSTTWLTEAGSAEATRPMPSIPFGGDARVEYQLNLANS